MTKDPGIIPPTGRCRCGRPSSLTLIEVENQNSHRRRVGSFSEYGDVQERAGKRRLVLRGDWRFIRWIEACLDCRHQDQQGRLAV